LRPAQRRLVVVPEEDILGVLLGTLFGALLVVASVSDLRAYRIPNVVVVALIVLFVLAALASGGEVRWWSHLGAGLLSFALGAAFFWYRLIGAGDVKLFAAVSLWTGFDLLPAYMMYLALFGGALLVVLIVVRKAAAVLARRSSTRPRLGLPRVLVPHEDIPYGVAIAAAVVPVWESIPLWSYPV
jgi:prepilin peptidase CpaA